MKVMFIDDSKPKNPAFAGPLLNYGSLYTVVDDQVTMGCPEYQLAECGKYWYSKSRFAPVSDIDETEFERNYKKELV